MHLDPISYRLLIAQREISLDWIVSVLENPDHEEPDPENPELYKAWGYIPKLGGRVLYVVYNKITEPAANCYCLL